MNTWNSDAVHREVAQTWESASAGWTHWEMHLVGAFWPVTLRMLRAANLSPGMHVLDVGSGIGDPALAAAQWVGPDGSVCMTDLSAGMLATARDRARAYGLTQVTAQVGAVEDLNLPAGHFDVVLARFSIMFFPNIPGGLTKLRESLRPGGRLVAAVWTPPEINEGFALPSRVVRDMVEIPASDPDAPGPFRLSGDGELALALHEAGFREVTVDEVQHYLFARDPAEYWSMLCAVSDSFRRLYAGLEESIKPRVRERLMGAVEAYRTGEVLRLPIRARIGWAVRNAR